MESLWLSSKLFTLASVPSISQLILDIIEQNNGFAYGIWITTPKHVIHFRCFFCPSNPVQSSLQVIHRCQLPTNQDLDLGLLKS
ncbi:hypothetical protein JHK82_054757 [Glycine max]|uniref:Uncharacterized protein n=2 Tax=Glycine subgen. Soja TaxID=1462606 RepID=A0A0R0F299_SOYBN|nr:hypothetical protein JHK86_054609 [Glycine max]RZB49831.1 hypothetical protein D0Y65_052643 [Glycine soja]KAG4929078.1 hypothetical protein JHK85_055564 [Glycine max]KAG5084588.1 hypothetical protein JHK84_054626 [Glycine max]KAG5087360.1 hypothetical protein JHK82_054757 [Glycine max]